MNKSSLVGLVNGALKPDCVRAGRSYVIASISLCSVCVHSSPMGRPLTSFYGRGLKACMDVKLSRAVLAADHGIPPHGVWAGKAAGPFAADVGVSSL